LSKGTLESSDLGYRERGKIRKRWCGYMLVIMYLEYLVLLIFQKNTTYSQRLKRKLIELTA
jgi:hypothetical protein